jgi:hypothetical protein
VSARGARRFRTHALFPNVSRTAEEASSRDVGCGDTVCVLVRRTFPQHPRKHLLCLPRIITVLHSVTGDVNDSWSRHGVDGGGVLWCDKPCESRPSSPAWALVSHFCLAEERHTPLPCQHLLLDHIAHIAITVRKSSHTTHE